MYKEYDPKDHTTWNSSIGLLCDGDEFEVVILYRPDLNDGKLVIIKDKLDRKEVDDHFFIALSRMFWDIDILYSYLEAKRLQEERTEYKPCSQVPNWHRDTLTLELPYNGGELPYYCASCGEAINYCICGHIIGDDHGWPVGCGCRK